jgi:hypothetical protein
MKKSDEKVLKKSLKKLKYVDIRDRSKINKIEYNINNVKYIDREGAPLKVISYENEYGVNQELILSFSTEPPVRLLGSFNDSQISKAEYDALMNEERRRERIKQIENQGKINKSEKQELIILKKICHKYWEDTVGKHIKENKRIMDKRRKNGLEKTSQKKIAKKNNKKWYEFWK